MKEPVFPLSQLTKKWKGVRRQFKAADASGDGRVTVSNFKKILRHCGIKLDSEQLYQVLEALDPHLSGQVSYKAFLNMIFAS